MIQILLAISLCFHPIDTLKVTDFKGTPDSALLSKGIVAHTETAWILWDSLDENNRHWWTLEFMFVPQDSWTITDCPSVLAHETTHYNISQLWYNKFKKELTKYQNCDNIGRAKMRKVLSKYWNNSRKLQVLFDRETKHSANRTLELIWERNINRDVAKQ